MPYSQGTGSGGTAGGQPQTPTDTTNYFNIAKQQMNSTNPGTAAAGVTASGQAPSVAGSDLTMEQLLQELGLAVPNVDVAAQGSALNTTYGLEQAQIGENQLGIQQQGLAAQLGLTNQQQGYEAAQYALQQQQYPEQLAQAATANKQAVMGLQGGQAIGGTASTPGAKLANQAQAQNYQFQQADINRAQQEAQLGQASEVAGYQYSAGDIARSQQNLEQTAAANGISVKQLLAQFQQGLQQIGYQGDPTSLLTQVISAEGTGVQALGTAAGTLGLTSPGSLLSAGQKSGLNLNTYFNGTGQ